MREARRPDKACGGCRTDVGPEDATLTGALVEDDVCKTVNETSGRTVTHDPRCVRRGVVCCSHDER
jgi:hypothetical protein